MGIQPEVIDEMGTQPSLGEQLRSGRGHLGMSVAEVSVRLKLSERIIRCLEADDFASLNDGVFLRGYVKSYARLVGLPVDIVHHVVRELTAPAPLIATGTIPRSRYLLDRWSVSATYLILTGLIVGPTVWLAMTHGGIEHSLVRTTPLDRAAQTMVVDPNVAQASADANADASTLPQALTSAAVRAIDDSTTPVKASLAPFVTSLGPESAAPVAVDNEHTVALSISEASWVEILKPDGTRLEYGVLPAGAERSYNSDTTLTVRIGNVAGTRLVVDGNTVDLAPLARGNVTHLRLFGDETTVARVEP